MDARPATPPWNGRSGEAGKPRCVVTAAGVAAMAEYEQAIVAAIAAVTQLPDAADDRDGARTETKRYLIALLESALRTLSGTDVLRVPTPAALGRALIGGNRPRDPSHPVFEAIDDVGRTGLAAAQATGRLCSDQA